MVQIYGKKLTKEKKESQQLHEESDFSLGAEGSKTKLVDNAYQR